MSCTIKASPGPIHRAVSWPSFIMLAASLGGRRVDLAAPRGDVLLADAVFLKDPLAEQIGVSGGMGHGDADGHLLFP